ncbi:hypothetical protein [Albidovulum sp.]|uniref:hypothetical protein n=1 Tax=Albidovulum sp. TaxID=1872424 RepID=UPI003D7D957F
MAFGAGNHTGRRPGPRTPRQLCRGARLGNPCADGRLYAAIRQAGQPHGIADFGLQAVNSHRMEKGDRDYGSELANRITLAEADSTASSPPTRASSAAGQRQRRCGKGGS